VKVSVIVVSVCGARLKLPEPLIPNGADGGLTVLVSCSEPVFPIPSVKLDVLPIVVGGKR